MPATLSTAAARELNTPEMQRRVNALRAIDNVTNWYWLAREYLFLALVAGLTIGFYEYREAAGLGWAWNVPATMLAMVLIGAGQHRLVNLGHEASHYMLFRNRKLNELTSDLFCMFPVWTTTHSYRLQHLAHHQFVNDPQHDPDVTQMRASGHRYRFPMSPRTFIWKCVIRPILWLPSLVRYVRVRARYANSGSGPYESKKPRSRLLYGVGVGYLLLTALLVTLFTFFGQPALLAAVPAGLLTAVLLFYARIPDRFWAKTLIKPDVSIRWQTCLRMAYSTGLFGGIGGLTLATNRPWALYYLLLWVVPLLTTFSFFMLLRQVVQHGNADQRRLTNTRIFLVGRLIRWAVFPLGMDYHLPHHLFPMVPHYRLKDLHELLLETDAYRQNAVVIEGYFLHRTPPQQPTVLEVMAEEPPGTAMERSPSIRADRSA